MITVGDYRFPSYVFVTREHMYFLPVGTGSKNDSQLYTCGLDDYIQQNIGLVQYIQFSTEESDICEAGSSIFSVETDKWVGHFVAPFMVNIVNRNHNVFDNPSLINKDCYGEGWVVQVRLTPQTKKLLTKLLYQEKLVIWIEKEIAAEE